MDEPTPPSLERALDVTQTDVETAVRSAASVTQALKKVRTAANVGNLRDLRSSFEQAERALLTLRQQFENARESWEFDEEAYFRDGHFVSEVIEAGRKANLNIYQQDEQLYSYPVLIRVAANDRSVLIDKVRDRRVRPSTLVATLSDLQRRPPRFKPDQFLESLYAAYEVVGKSLVADSFQPGTPLQLRQLYDVLTMLPGQAREYTRQEFARDIYLLDKSGVSTTRKNMSMSFHASAGSRSASALLRVIREDGAESIYYAIAFTPAG